MGGGLFRRTALTLLLILVPIAAKADEYVACWHERVFDPVAAREYSITRCRLAGGEIIDFPSDSDIPDRLYPAMGTVAGVVCWYYTSIPNALWELIQVYPTGEADIAIRSSDGTPVPVGLYARCNSEPTPTDPVETVWDYVMSYIHPPPTPELDPAPGLGVTGLETRLGVAVPPHHEAVLSAGGLILELEIEVPRVVVHWGDGIVTTHPTDGPALVAGPDSPATHVYESKDDEAELTVAYDWTARWRTIGGPWQTLPVPNTITTVGYPVSEIVAVLGS